MCVKGYCKNFLKFLGEEEMERFRNSACANVLRNHSSTERKPIQRFALGEFNAYIFTRKKQPTKVDCFFLAEMERFELSRRLSRPTPLAGAPLRPLEYISIYSMKLPKVFSFAPAIIHHLSGIVKSILPYFQKCFCSQNIIVLYIDKYFGE